MQAVDSEERIEKGQKSPHFSTVQSFHPCWYHSSQQQSQQKASALVVRRGDPPTVSFMAQNTHYNVVHDEQQQDSATFLPSATLDYRLLPTQFEIGHMMGHTACPYVDPFFGGIIAAAYGAQMAISPPLLRTQQECVRLPLEIVEGGLVYFVNPKQYNGIMRRRRVRAKAESENKIVRVRKPYLHESRHLHAVRRARGVGGRFLNTKNKDSTKLGTDCSNSFSSGNSSDAGSRDSFKARKVEHSSKYVQRLDEIASIDMQGQVLGAMEQPNNGAYVVAPSHRGPGILHKNQLRQAFCPLRGGFHESERGENGECC